MKRLFKVKIKWSPNFAYAIGLITTDGNLSTDGRHLSLTSKDKILIKTFKRCLNIKNKIGRKGRGGSKEKKYFLVQFGDINFYDFLLTLGLMPAKSKSIDSLDIPNKFFRDFFRGCIDGDGSMDIHAHPESQWPQLRIRLYSASLNFVTWVKSRLDKELKLQGGWIEKYKGCGVYLLSYGKFDSITLLNYMYYAGVESYLNRKYLKIKTFLRM